VKICIYGAGAIGGYLAGSLAHAGIDTSIVVRGAHLDAIKADGLTVETKEATFTTRPRASADPAELGPQDAVLVSVKAPSLPSVAGAIAPLLKPDTPVVFVTNGIPWWYFQALDDSRRLALLDPGDVLRDAVGLERVVGGIFWPASSVPKPGHIRMVSAAGRGTTIGRPDGAVTPAMEAIGRAFAAAGLPFAAVPNLRDLIWEKLIFNLSCGPMCVLTSATSEGVYREPAAIAASRRLLAEGSALAAACGAKVAIDVERIVATNTNLAHRPSILQDLMAGRPMEIDSLYTVPLQMAAAAGVAMPTLELLAALIRVRAREAGLYPPA
jgi:2-dehydropantoate 2-reductase